MKFTLHRPSNIHVIRGYTAGEIIIGEQVYRRTVVVTPQQVITDWPPATIDALDAGHLDALCALEPEIVLIGSGAAQQFPDHALLARAMARGIGLEVMDTGAACRTYNILASEDRRVLAALFMETARSG
jgi:uncharacterized protein